MIAQYLSRGVTLIQRVDVLHMLVERKNLLKNAEPFFKGGMEISGRKDRKGKTEARVDGLPGFALPLIPLTHW